jgi:signal transduction histidine kinase
MKGKRIIEGAYKKSTNFEFEHRIIRPDGTTRVLWCRGEMITNSQGEPVKMIGTGQDITEIKEVERKLKLYSDQLRRLSAHQEKVRENERIRIARELHDELGQMLSVLKMDVFLAVEKSREQFDGKAGNEFLKEFKTIIERIDTIIRSVQRITSELRPEVLDDLGLEEAIKWQVQEFEKRTKISTEFVNNGGKLDNVEDELSTAIFRILQETMTNVLRHSKASKVQVSPRK